jgi:hypothetical protein
MIPSDMKQLLDTQHKYNDLFIAAINYLEAHPKSRIESMCINDSSPYIWFKLDEDDITVTTEFILKSDDV